MKYTHSQKLEDMLSNTNYKTVEGIYKTNYANLSPNLAHHTNSYNCFQIVSHICDSNDWANAISEMDKQMILIKSEDADMEYVYYHTIKTNDHDGAKFYCRLLMLATNEQVLVDMFDKQKIIFQQ